MLCRRVFSQSTSRLHARFLSGVARPDILRADRVSLYQFGTPTSDPSKALFRDLTWTIRDQSPATGNPEAWALIGPKAASLGDSALLGRARADPPERRTWPFLDISTPVESVIKKVAFQTRLESTSHLAQAGAFVDYTARYHSIRPDEEDAITLRQHLEKALISMGQEHPADDRLLLDTTIALKLDHLLDIPLVALSNGQTRRARIARALLAQPEVLILEEPFTGLDTKSRQVIADLLGALHAARAPRIVLILRPQDAIPHWIDHIAEVTTGAQQADFMGARSSWQTTATPVQSIQRQDNERIVADAASPTLIELDEVTVAYSNRKVLDKISWFAREGDRIALTGANGSGKSTLLSIITGDHPASYSQSLTLFGEPRSKHSVYSLSAKVGHFSPELYAAFPRRHGEAGLSIYETIGTGFENVFSYRKLSNEQREQIDRLVKQFDPSSETLTKQTLHETLFVEASAPIQALALILRAAIKKPALLILDEPFAGMDDGLVQQCRRFLDESLAPSQTLIFISHYPEEWPATLGRRLHLEDGRAVESLL